MSSGSKWPKNQKHQDNHSQSAPSAERLALGDLAMKLAAWWELDFPAFRAEIQKDSIVTSSSKTVMTGRNGSKPAAPSTALALRQ